MWYIHLMKYHSVMRMKKLKVYATAWLPQKWYWVRQAIKMSTVWFLLHQAQERQSQWPKPLEVRVLVGYPMLGSGDWEGTWREFWDFYNILFAGFCLYECVYFVNIHLSVYTYNLCTFLTYCVSRMEKGLRFTLLASLPQFLWMLLGDTTLLSQRQGS